MEISFRGQYDKDLFYRAVILANQPPRNRRLMNLFMGIFVLAAGVILVQRVIESGNILENAAYIALLMIVAAFVVRPIFQPRLAARRMWNNPALQRPLAGIVDKQGITYTLEAGQNHIPWENINRMKKNAAMVTLVTITGLLLIFPNRFFKNDADWGRFNALIEKKVIVVK